MLDQLHQLESHPMTTLPETQDNSQATSPRLGGRFRVVLEPFGPGVSAVSFERCGLYMPDVSRLSLADAAQAWAKAGFFVLPIKAGSKNAGSLLGAGWPQRSTRDRAVIASWWARWPDAGIAVHTGRSGVVVADMRNCQYLWIGVFQATSVPAC